MNILETTWKGALRMICVSTLVWSSQSLRFRSDAAPFLLALARLSAMNAPRRCFLLASIGVWVMESLGK
jgi:hypothetical protein